MKRNRTKDQQWKDLETSNKQKRVSRLLEGIGHPGVREAPSASEATTKDSDGLDGGDEDQNQRHGSGDVDSEEDMPDSALIAALSKVDRLNNTHHLVEKLLKEFPRTVAAEAKVENIAPIDIALETQLCDLDENKTRTENEVEALCRNGVYLRLYLPATPEQSVLVRKSEYENYVRNLCTQESTSELASRVGKCFVAWLDEKRDCTPVCSRNYIDRIQQMVNQDMGRRKAERIITIDCIVRELLQLGVIMRRGDLSSKIQDFWITLPNSIKIQDYIEIGRRELKNRLQRRQYHEIERSYLESKNRRKFGRSPLPASFHIQDAIGASIVLVRKRATGEFVQLNTHHRSAPTVVTGNRGRRR